MRARRSQRRPFSRGVIFALPLLVILIIGYFLNWFSPNKLPDIVLPSSQPSGQSQPSSQTSSAAPSDTPRPTPMIQLEVNADNVQQIVENLSRPSQYQCGWRVEWFWEGGSATAKRRVYARDGWIKTDIYDPDGSLRHHHITGEGHTFIFSQGFWKPEQGDFNADNEAALPTYETIKMLDREDILDAGFQAWDDMPCIYISFQAGDTRYVDTYWLSYNDGLPFQMERSDNGVAVIRCVRESLELVRPGDDEFLLPDNRLAWETES